MSSLRRSKKVDDVESEMELFLILSLQILKKRQFNHEARQKEWAN